MKNRFFTLLALATALGFASCEKTDTQADSTHNPLRGKVWETSSYESASGSFTSFTDRLLFKTDSTGEIFSSSSIVYFSGSIPAEEWDTTVVMTYRLDEGSNMLYISSDYAGNPGQLKYDPEKETLTNVNNGDKYIRVM